MKYAVKKVFTDGEESLLLFHTLSAAKEVYEIALKYSELYDQIYLTKYTKTRGLGMIIRHYVG